MHHASNVTNISSIPTHIRKKNVMCDVILTSSLRRGKTAMHVIKQTFKIVLNHKYGIFALLFIQAHIFEEKLKKNMCEWEV